MEDTSKVTNVFDNIEDNDELEDIILNATAPTTNEEPKEKIEEDKKEEEEVEEKKEENLTPLQKLRQEHDEKGLIISNHELEEGSNEGPKMDIVHNEDRIDDWDKAELEIEDNFRRRAAVVQIREYNTQPEYMKMIEELNSVYFDATGAHFMDPEHVIYFRLRTPEDPPYTAEEVAKGVPAPESLEHDKAIDNSEDGSTNAAEVADDVEDENNKETKPVDKDTIQIIIDKTGLGTDFAFTDEERAKIQQAETIQVNELKVVDIASIKSKRSQKSFQDVVKEHDLSGNRVKICFPASGFKADMKGLTYGEYADVALAMDNITTDQYYKRLSVIYNKMTNISCGAFENFEDFLHKFAYTDIPLALYAMYIATEPEITDIQLRCTRPNCGKNYAWKYSPRSLLRLDKCSEDVRNKMKEIVTADAIDYDRLAEESDVRNSKYIKLEKSGFIVEIGVASAYEFIYNFVPLMDEDNFREQFGNVSQAYLDNVILLTVVRSILIPDGEEYIVCDTYKDMLDAIYNISPEEIKILTAYTLDTQDKFETAFSFGKVVCPHCKAITNSLDISMDEIVFRTYSRLMNTRVKLSITQDS